MIAAYQRISRADGDLGKDGKDKSNSIENQKELIQRYISCKESLQNVPVMDFVDDGYTGSNFDRPGFQQMMDGVRNGKIDTIIVKDLSRFGRDYIGVGEYMEQIFPLLGVRLIAISLVPSPRIARSKIRRTIFAAGGSMINAPFLSGSN